MANPFLSVRGLQAGYGRAQVLFDVSFDVQPGEVITLLGRNGMGRSTTVKCLFGMLPSRDVSHQAEVGLVELACPASNQLEKIGRQSQQCRKD